MKKKCLILIIITILLCNAGEAYAYINPGSGSDYFQVIMATIVSIGVSFKRIFTKITSFFVKNSDTNRYE